jgi:hypothetical protein
MTRGPPPPTVMALCLMRCYNFIFKRLDDAVSHDRMIRLVAI